MAPMRWSFCRAVASGCDTASRKSRPSALDVDARDRVRGVLGDLPFVEQPPQRHASAICAATADPAEVPTRMSESSNARAGGRRLVGDALEDSGLPGDSCQPAAGEDQRVSAHTVAVCQPITACRRRPGQPG